MDNTGLMTVEHNQVSTNVFSDPESFQKIFDIGKICIIFPGATGLSRKTDGLHDCC